MADWQYTSFPFAFHGAFPSTTSFHWHCSRSIRSKIGTLIGIPIPAMHGFQNGNIGRKDNS